MSVKTLSLCDFLIFFMFRIDSLKFFGATSLGIPFIYLTTGRVVEFLQKLQVHVPC